ncbi:MAG: TetR family transcriptional regulator [Pseudomonadota bacterium]
MKENTVRKVAPPAADPASSQDDARERILAAAERLFAQKGIDKSSMRELTAMAGVNVASVNYYFRSKEGLAEELLDNVSARVNKSRLAELDGVMQEAAAAKRPPPLEAILLSFVRPYTGEDYGPGGPLLAQLILQHRVVPSDMTVRIIERHFDGMALRYIDALANAVPGVDRTEWFWRYTFMVSTVILTVTDQSTHNRLARMSGGAADTTRHDELNRYLLRFLAGALTAPAVAPSERGVQ